MVRFEYNYNNSKLKERRKELRNNSTKAELMLWERIRKNQILGVKFRRQFSIHSYVVDFYCTEFKLAIEVDGVTHSSDDEKEYDANRQKSLENISVTFLRYNNSEIFMNIESVVDRIKDKITELKARAKVSPYQGEI